MKKINIVIVLASIFLLSATYDQPQEKYYYAFDEKIPLYEAPNKVVLRFEKEYFSEMQTSLQKNAQIKQVGFNSDNGHCILTITENSDVRALTAELKRQVGVKSVNPMYLIYGGTEAGVTDEIVVQFKEHASQQEIEDIYKKFRLKVIEINRSYQILSVPIDLDPLEVANTIQTSGLANFSYPDFLMKVEKFQALPTDPYFSNQYYLRNTGQTVNGRTSTAGADINVVNAWNITKGNIDIVVAVIDEGVSSNHPDLPNTRQVRLNGSDFTVSPPGNNPSPAGNDNHGNACAGIIAASHNNEGIAGIAPNCKIMPIRVPFNVNYDPSSRFAAAIRFAVDKGADVISNSWGFTFFNAQGQVRVPSSNEVPAIVTEIQYATTNGRSKKGCVVVFAAGNTANHAGTPAIAGYVQFPANVNIAGVLTVGASDRNDLQANYSPTSVLTGNNNQIIDVVAPSHRSYNCHIPGESFDVWTIDIPGNAGYNPIPPITPQLNYTDCGALTVGTFNPSTGTNFADYTAHFGGTSAACPQVAGVAALMLSVNPTLTQAQVATIIRSTARKTTTYTYATTQGRNDGTWNDRMGYGVLNATAALNAVPVISGPSTVCYSGNSFSLSPSISGTIYWTVTGSFSFSSSSNVTSTTSSQPTVYKTISSSSVDGVLTAHIGSSSGPAIAYKSLTPCVTTITGPNEIFSGSPGQYNLTNPPVATTIYWTVSNTSLFSVVSSNCPTTVTRIGAGTGNATLSARVGSTSGTVFATKTISAPGLPAISGPTLICYKTSTPYYNFTATNWQSSYQWDVSSNLTIKSGQGTNTASVNAASSGSSGTGYVRVMLGSTELVKYNVWVGAPAVSSISGPTSVSPGSYNNYQAIYNNLSAPTSFYWIFNQVGVGYSYQTTSSPYAGFYFYDSGSYQVVCQATNACGQGGTTAIGVYAGRGATSGNVYPNPVSDILYIELDSPANLKVPPTYDVRLYDSQGNILRQQKAQGGTVQFNVSTLPDGIYYLHIYDGVSETPEMHQIMVEH